MKKITLLCLLLLLAIGVHAQEFSERNWHADKLFTIPEFRIHASTIATQDNYKISIAGGGSDTNTRGGRLVLHGVNTPSVAGTAELQAAGSGSLQLLSNSTGNIDINSKGTGAVRLYSTNTLRWSIPTDATATNKPLKFGSVGEANPHAVISANTSDGGDSGRLTLTGGGGVGSTRGGRLELYGSDSGGAGAGGNILLSTGDSGTIDVAVSNTTRWQFASKTGTSWLRYVGGNSALISPNTASGSDNSSLTISSAGDGSAERGAAVTVHGKQHSSVPGLLALYGGETSRGIWFFTGAGTPIVRWSIDGDGTLLNDSLGGGNLMMQPDTGIKWGTTGTLYSNFLPVGNTGCSLVGGDTLGMSIDGVQKRIPVCD